MPRVMKGVKSRILKKLNSIPQVAYLKQTPQTHINGELDDNKENDMTMTMTMTMRRIVPRPPPPPKQPDQQAEISFRPPDPDSATLFDPNLLDAFRQAVADYTRSLELAKTKIEDVPRVKKEEEEEPPSKVPRKEEGEEEEEPLAEFEYKCPPRGEGRIVLYTTSLRGVRKTFEDCNSVRLLLQSLKLAFVERDLSMHMEFREEVSRALGLLRPATPPRLFVKGRYVGGADQVLGLHEQGRLLPLLRGMPTVRSVDHSCVGCGGMRFLVCGECNGGRKVFVALAGEEEKTVVQCRRCNENGLLLCPLCC